MPIRPARSLSLEELVQLLDNPAFFECFEFAYDMYHLRRRFVQFTTTGEFAVRDPLGPVITPHNDPSFGGIAAPIAEFGTLNAFSTAGPISDPVASTLMQALPLPQQGPSAMSWAQLSGADGLIQGADRVAPFDIEAAPMGPGINVGQDQTLNSLTHNDTFTPAQAAFPQLTDLEDNFGMNDNWDSLFGTAMYSGAAQGPSFDPLSLAQVQTPVMSPVSSNSMGDADNSNSSLFSPNMSESEANGGPDIHEEDSSGASITTPTSLDNRFSPY